jgi:SPP1 gp7 family putative phage head morphogenesis protein
MPTTNEALRDADINHQVDLQQYSNYVVQRMIALLNKVDPDLFAQLTAALEQLSPASFTVERLEQLLASVRALNAQAYQQINRELTEELRKFTEYESGYQFQLFRTVIPTQVIAQVDVAMVSANQVYAAAMARPFQGRLLRQWASSIEADRMTRIRDAVSIGFAENQSVSQIVKRIRGTKAQRYEDGIINIDRRRAETVVRTAISHVAAVTRNRFYKANSDLIKSVQWLSTIDSRTSEGCMIRDGKQYTADDAHKPIGHSIPWLAGPGALHWNCRSTSVPVTRSWKELGGADIEGFSPSTRASMDGQIPAETTFGEWIEKQSAARQDDKLGPTRGKLLRDGGLKFDRLYNEKGVFLDLNELRKRDAEAFRKAGL